MASEGEHNWKFAQCFGDKGEVEDITEGMEYTLEKKNRHQYLDITMGYIQLSLPFFLSFSIWCLFVSLLLFCFEIRNQKNKKKQKKDWAPVDGSNALHLFLKKKTNSLEERNDSDGDEKKNTIQTHTV